MTWFDWVIEFKAKDRPKEPQVNFAPAAVQALRLARAEAERLTHDFVGTEHLLLGLIKLNDGVCVGVLHKLGLQPQTVCMEIENFVGSGTGQLPYGNIPYTPRSKKVIELANKEAKALNHSSVRPEDLLLGLLAEGGGVAGKVLRSFNVDLAPMRIAILEKNQNSPPDVIAVQQKL